MRSRTIGLIGRCATGRIAPGASDRDARGRGERELHRKGGSVWSTCRVTARQAARVEVPGIGRVMATSPGAATGSSCLRARPAPRARTSAADRLLQAGARGRQCPGHPEVDHIELFGRGQARREQPQFRAVPGQGLRPLALRHRHERQARLPRRRRQARRRRRVDSGEHHRQRFRARYRWRTAPTGKSCPPSPAGARHGRGRRCGSIPTTRSAGGFAPKPAAPAARAPRPTSPVRLQAILRVFICS